MTPILIDLPETIETSRLKLHMPRAEFSQLIHEVIMEGYEDYVKWLAWPLNPPSLKEVEVECRKHHAEFILRDFVRYIITDKETGRVLGRCAFPPFQANWAVPKFGISYFIRQSERSKGYGAEAIHAMTLWFWNLKSS